MIQVQILGLPVSSFETVVKLLNVLMPRFFSCFAVYLVRVVERRRNLIYLNMLRNLIMQY